MSAFTRCRVFYLLKPRAPAPAGRPATLKNQVWFHPSFCKGLSETSFSKKANTQQLPASTQRHSRATDKKFTFPPIRLWPCSSGSLLLLLLTCMQMVYHHYVPSLGDELSHWRGEFYCLWSTCWRQIPIFSLVLSSFSDWSIPWFC